MVELVEFGTFCRVRGDVIGFKNYQSSLISINYHRTSAFHAYPGRLNLKGWKAPLYVLLLTTKPGVPRQPRPCKACIKGSFIKVSQCNPASIYFLDHDLVLIRCWIHESEPSSEPALSQDLQALWVSAESSLDFGSNIGSASYWHTLDHWLGLLTHRNGHWIAGLAAGLPL